MSNSVSTSLSSWTSTTTGSVSLAWISDSWISNCVYLTERFDKCMWFQYVGLVKWFRHWKWMRQLLGRSKASQLAQHRLCRRCSRLQVKLVHWGWLMCVMLERGMVKYPEDWSKSWMVNSYKRKGDAVTHGSCRGIRMLEHAKNVLERVIEGRLYKLEWLTICSLDLWQVGARQVLFS